MFAFISLHSLFDSIFSTCPYFQAETAKNPNRSALYSRNFEEPVPSLAALSHKTSLKSSLLPTRSLGAHKASYSHAGSRQTIFNVTRRFYRSGSKVRTNKSQPEAGPTIPRVTFLLLLRIFCTFPRVPSTLLPFVSIHAP